VCADIGELALELAASGTSTEEVVVEIAVLNRRKLVGIVPKKSLLAR